MNNVYLVGFDLKAMKGYADKIGGYFEQGIYTDRFMGIEAENGEQAIQMFLDKKKTWIRQEEKRFVMIVDETDKGTWEQEYYRSEYAWMRRKEIV